jgi:hypothetical protein
MLGRLLLLRVLAVLAVAANPAGAGKVHQLSAHATLPTSADMSTGRLETIVMCMPGGSVSPPQLAHRWAHTSRS